MDKIDELKEKYGDKLSDIGEDARDRLGRGAARAREKSAEFWEEAAGLIREHPGQSMGIAFLAGLVVGGLLGGGLPSGAEEETPGSEEEPSETPEGLKRARAGLAATLVNLRGVLDEAIRKLEG